MKKLFLTLLLIPLFAIQGANPFLAVVAKKKAATSPVLFSDGFESGNFSAFDSEVDSSAKIDVSSTLAHSGSVSF